MATHAESRLIVCLTGPESTGKSTMAKALANEFSAPVVPEVAREYFRNQVLDKNGYEAQDVLEIARLQLAAEQTLIDADPQLIICDTDLLVLRIWWEEKYGLLDPWLKEALLRRSKRRYLLMFPDIPWEPDPLRDAPHDRMRLVARYQQTLTEDGFPYVEIHGTGEIRIEAGIKQVRTWLVDADPVHR